MYVLTNQCGHRVWTQDARLSENYTDEHEKVAMYPTDVDANEAAIAIADEEGILLRVMNYREFVAQDLKESKRIRKIISKELRHVKYLPCERRIVSKDTGDVVGITLFLVVEKGDACGLIFQDKDGEVQSFVNEDFYDFQEEYRLDMKSALCPDWLKANVN